jgi:hypothetical protein
MQDSTFECHVNSLRLVRDKIGCGEVFEQRFTWSLCVDFYGRTFSDRTWRSWKETALAQDDAPELGGFFSAATHYLLLAQAMLRHGNKPGETRNQVSRLRLSHAALKIKAKQDLLPNELPDSISYLDLLAYVETQALRPYSDRHHRRNGLKASQGFYTRNEAIIIASRYPNHRIKREKAA